ncbi:MAG: 3-deoxy-D-manno-octulosonic-acid transferase [Desulfuromonadales bacterium]|nr:3-deoxy-D-manno-octulosonic-acid transferase [Desulfuromonadales bacterium]
MYLLYDLIWLVGAAALVPWYLLRRLCGGKNRQGLRERFGWYAPGRLSLLKGRPILWLHAVSVGETRAAVSLIRALKRTYPDHALVLTNVTETGHAVAENIDEIDLSLFFPFDLSWAVRRVLKRLSPDLVIIVETEIWPNLVRCAKQASIPLVLVNGRLSDRSFPRYRKMRFFLRPVLNRFAALCMQTQQDKERILSLGASAGRVAVTGNLKFDMSCDGVSAMNPTDLRSMYKLPADSLVWVAGSTHSGEEEPILDAYCKMRDRGIGLCLVLAPRHPGRAQEVGQMLTARGLNWVARTSLSEKSGILRHGDVLLIDTVGELLKLYAAADVVFVGGSLAPVGGHNVLEASLLKKPVLFGPHMANFREIARLLIEAGGGKTVSENELSEELLTLLTDAEARADMGLAGYGFLQQHAGATERTVEVIRQQLGA